MRVVVNMLIFHVAWFVSLVVKSKAQSVVKGGLIASSVRFSSVNNMQSGIIFGSGLNEIKLMSDPQHGLVIKSPSGPMIAFKPDNTIDLYSEKFCIQSALDIGGPFNVNGIAQWRLVHREDFSSKVATGWDNKNPNLVTECAGLYMLGGYGIFAKGEITKKIPDLPPHNFIRIKAIYHFIDAWIGETGFMRLNIGKDGSLVHVWTDRHNQDNDMLSVNVCGAGTGEGKFAVPIDISVPHTSDSVIVGFGSTIETDDPFDQSWGISSLEIYVR